MNDLDPVIEVFPELAFPDHVVQVAVGRGDDPNVDVGGGGLGSHATNLARFEKPEQQGLHARTHVPDLVEKDGALVGELEGADLVAIGSRKAAPHMPEQLRFEQRFGDTRAIQRHEWLLCPWRVSVNEPREYVFADTALAGDGNFDVACSGVRGQSDRTLQSGARPDDRRLSVQVEVCVVFPHLPLERDTTPCPWRQDSVQVRGRAGARCLPSPFCGKNGKNCSKCWGTDS
jgi:hypothetical protein